MDRTALVEKYDGELVGGRVIIIVDGKKQYITEVTEDGKWQLNLFGRELEEASRAREQIKPVKPTKGIPQKV